MGDYFVVLSISLNKVFMFKRSLLRSTYFVKFIRLLTTNGFIPSMVDPILMCMTTSKGIALLAFHVDGKIFY